MKSFIGEIGNAGAKKLGLENTDFDSFDGIGNGSDWSTPRDRTKIASSAMKNATFRAIVKTKKYTAKTKTKTGGTRTMAPWVNTDAC
ncbi:D-alanyl-D-alanine carboxypeptidase OS=Streptomyces tendae OX=1932 GN=F3L20_00325 PE=3 SV=1 [Streptomyces tendae]